MDSGPLILVTSGQIPRGRGSAYFSGLISSGNLHRMLISRVAGAGIRAARVFSDAGQAPVGIVASVALIFGVVFIATLRATRIYDASGSIAINKPDPMTFNFKDSNGTGMGDYDSSDIETVTILRLALQVIKQFESGPEAGIRRWWEPATLIFGLTTDTLQPNSTATWGCYLLSEAICTV